MPTDLLVGSAIATATAVAIKVAPDVERRREDADDLHDNRVRLQYEISLLTARRNDVREEIKKGKATKMKKMTHECEVWLNTAPVLITMAQQLEAEYLEITRNHYIMKWFQQKAKLSRKMKKKADEITSFCSRMTPDKAMSDMAPVVPCLTLSSEEINESPPVVPCLTLSSEEINESPWIKHNVDGIWTLLQDKGLKKIGIYASMGMGKTTIMSSLHDKAWKDREFFEHVIFIFVQDNDNEETIQRHIMDQLDIDVKDILSTNQFADAISRALQDKKYLLLIDQLTQKIDLKKLGIQDDHCAGKVVVATGVRRVCQDMGLDSSFPIQEMSEDDAWYMFRQIAGPVADHTKIKPYARLIAQGCGSNPSLIKAVAEYLNNKGDEDIWRDCKVKLQSCRDHYHQSFDDAYNEFKLLFEQLNDSRERCLLPGALCPQNHEIECCRAEEFIPRAGGASESNEQQIFWRASCDELAMEHVMDGGILEKSTKAKYVKKPSLCRKWPFRSRDGPKMLVGLSDEEIKNYPAPKNRGVRTRISLKCKNLRKMLEGVSPHKIFTLNLQRNEAPGLVVLNLSYCRITSLPSSICKLTQLEQLYVNGCRGLCALPTEIKELKNLEVLDISQTGIPSWPAEIGNLSSLKRWKVSLTENVVNSNQSTMQAVNIVSRSITCLKKVVGHDHTVVQPTNIISRLHQLNMLTILVDERCPSWWEGVADTIVDEIVSLKFLTTLCFYFPTVNCLECFLVNSLSSNNIDNIWEARPFRSFEIVVGFFREKNKIDLSMYKAERHLKVFAPEEPLQAISPILQQADAFELAGHQIIEHLAGLGTENMARLKICAVQGCCKMRSIFRTDDTTGAVVLPELERLHLFGLRNLTAIIEGKLGGESFVNLTTLTVHSCQGLSVILSLELARLLPKLEHLRVEKCYNAQAIIECDRHGGRRGTALDSNLKKLELINLPNLKWIGHEISLMCPALQELEVDDCDSLRDFPSVVSVAMKLTWFRCKHSLWNQLSQECRSRPHLSHSVIELPNPINNPPQQEEQGRNGLNPSN